MNNKCFTYLLSCVFIQLLVACTNNTKVSEEVKENLSIIDTIDNTCYIAEIDSSEQKKDSVIIYYHQNLGQFYFHDYRELKMILRGSKKSGMNLDSLIIKYRYSLPYAADSIKKWWNDNSLEKDDEDDEEYI